MTSSRREQERQEWIRELLELSEWHQPELKEGLVPDWLTSLPGIVTAFGIGAVLKSVVNRRLNRRRSELSVEAEEHKLESDENE